MRLLGAVLVILCVGLTLTQGIGVCSQIEASTSFLSEEENQGPTIEWGGPDAANETVWLAWDGAYDGQTEENWNLWAWINDTDGIDAVIFMLRDAAETDWTNVTPIEVRDNNTNGRYYHNYTYAVWWNYTLGRPQVEGSGGNFDFKIFANDTLGYSTETGILSYMGGYMIVNPPPEIAFFNNLIPSVIGACVIITAITLVVLHRRRGSSSL